jgi:REP element-mobilizing transposase RayT
MRHPRLKPDWQDTWHHCYNHAVGTCEDRPFDDADKEQFVHIMMRVAGFYCVQIVAYQVMSNHWHILLRAPKAEPSEEETIRRFEAFHRGKRRLLPGSKLCVQWRERLRDVSWCMRHLQHLYTAWFNRTRPVRRRGPLWAGRFKNTVLDTGSALWACWAYIERNPVRARMVADPADYRFCSFGVWAQTGRHPFAQALLEVLRPALPDELNSLDPKDLRAALSAEFARLAAEERAKAGQAAADVAMAAATAPVVGAEPAFTLSARRRVRHWVDGLVIGSELFVRETMRRVRTEPELARHRLAWAEVPAAGRNPVCCWRRLRVIRV